MRIKLLLLLAFIILFSEIAAAAPVCFADESCVLYGSCKNLTYAVSTARITIYYPNTSIFINNQSMTEISTGKFNFTFKAPGIIGNYLEIIECNIGGFLGYDEDEFTIGESKMISNEIYEVSKLLFLGFMFLIHFALLLIGFRSKAKVFVGMGAILGLVACIVGIVNLGIMTAFGKLATLFFSAYGLFAIGLLTFIFWIKTEENE